MAENLVYPTTRSFVNYRTDDISLAYPTITL